MKYTLAILVIILPMTPTFCAKANTWYNYNQYLIVGRQLGFYHLHLLMFVNLMSNAKKLYGYHYSVDWTTKLYY